MEFGRIRVNSRQRLFAVGGERLAPRFTVKLLFRDWQLVSDSTSDGVSNIVGREHIGTFRIAHVASTSSLASVRYCAPVGKVCVLSSITNAKVRSQPSPTGQMPREALLPISGHSVTISS
ncbi:hypothetical protein HZH66_013764 [Vespula vulgaris]|uniref:Uncharacterized protein n=1 Tax=Vespula vulgaris TaxID=7454 RepID=A0A834J4J4_VESVU|nr:hypothetical protein HZH66_013764 [Vespula vulgaris]